MMLTLAIVGIAVLWVLGIFAGAFLGAIAAQALICSQLRERADRFLDKPGTRFAIRTIAFAIDGKEKPLSP